MDTRAVQETLANFFTRTNKDLGVGAVDDDRFTVFDHVDNAPGLTDHGNIQRPGDDRNMSRRRAFLKHQSAQFRTVIIQQLRWSHVAGN